MSNLVSPSNAIVLFPTSFALGFDLNEPTQKYAWAAIALLAAAGVAYTMLAKGPYDGIPAVGGTNIVSSYLGAIRFFRHGRDMIQDGYDKYKPGAFRVPQINRWHVVVSGERLVEELRKAPDDTLNFSAAIDELFLIKYLLGQSITSHPFHIYVIQSQLTRNLGTLFPDVRDEVMHAFEDIIPLRDEWSRVTAYDAVLQIVARVTNRIFVGAPLCRNPDYTSLNIKYTMHVAKARSIIQIFPNFLKPIAAKLFTNVPTSTRLSLKHLKPLIDERQKKIDEYGPDYPDKPNDCLSWLMDEPAGGERTPKEIAIRILALNFAAIQTSSMSFTHALFHLASQPQYIAPIREEVEAVIAAEGWTKAAMTRMRKLDSLLKESQRVNGNGALTMSRVALKDFTFSDGTYIPKGAMVSAAARARHHDEDVYADSDTFDAFRFSDIRDQSGQGTKNQFVATNSDYISFGHGRHACPGRFFAANELKAMLAHTVLTYDIRMENEGIRPENQWFGLLNMPNTKAEVLFRRRQT